MKVKLKYGKNGGLRNPPFLGNNIAVGTTIY